MKIKHEPFNTVSYGSFLPGTKCSLSRFSKHKSGKRDSNTNSAMVAEMVMYCETLSEIVKKLKFITSLYPKTICKSSLNCVFYTYPYRLVYIHTYFVSLKCRIDDKNTIFHYEVKTNILSHIGDT